jgi:predicted neuraminidase
MIWLLAVAFVGLSSAAFGAPQLEAEQIFPVNPRQTHAPSIVECPNGDLLAAWYRGTEGPEEDASIHGSRKKKGDSKWSEPFPVVDRKGFGDCNTCMMIDSQKRLWLFWPTIIGESWESSLMNYAVSTDFEKEGPPKWDCFEIMLLKPADFKAEALELLGDRKLRPPRGAIATGEDPQRAKLNDPLYQRLGWAPRCKPTVLPSGRFVLPLYTDTWSISIMAISDDAGANWYASKPLIGFGNIQPTVLRKSDGTLVAYMRENGGKRRIRVSESVDDGITWGPVGESELPNPGSGIDAVRLENGNWVLVYNDKGRVSLAVSLSEDEGKTWKFTRHLEQHAGGRYHYPAVIQAPDGTIHAIYSTFIAPDPATAKPGPNGKIPEFVDKGIKHAAFNEEWIRAGD